MITKIGNFGQFLVSSTRPKKDEVVALPMAASTGALAGAGLGYGSLKLLPTKAEKELAQYKVDRAARDAKAKELFNKLDSGEISIEKLISNPIDYGLHNTPKDLEELYRRGAARADILKTFVDAMNDVYNGVDTRINLENKARLHGQGRIGAAMLGTAGALTAGAYLLNRAKRNKEKG